MRYENAASKKGIAISKEVPITRYGLEEKHTCTIEIGKIHADKPREYACTYVYSQGDFKITILAQNRDDTAEEASTDLFSLDIIAKNIPIRRKSFHKLSLYFDHGNYETLVCDNESVTALYMRSELFNFRTLPFPRMLFLQDLKTHTLDTQATVQNLLNNINSELPENPLLCFSFSSMTTDKQKSERIF